MISNSNIKETQAYFDTNPKHVKNAVEEYPIMYREAAEQIDKHSHGNVLDIGSGGVINYNTEKIQTLFLADIASANKERAKEKGIVISADMRMLGIKKNTMDCVVIQHLLHHLADNTLEKSLQNLTKGINESYRVLKQGGKLLIIEGLVPLPLDLLQRALFDINKHLYKAFFNFPMVLQYSEHKVINELKNAGFIIEQKETIKDGTVLPIFGMNIPRRFIPLKHRFIVAVKQK